MRYHRWVIRLKDKNGLTRYADAGFTYITWTKSIRDARKFSTRSTARYELKRNKRNNPHYWHDKAFQGITATVIKINISIEEA